MAVGGKMFHSISTDHRTVFLGSNRSGTLILHSPCPIVVNYTLKSVQNSQRSRNCMLRCYNGVLWLLDTFSNTKMCLTLNSEEFPSTGAKSTIWIALSARASYLNQRKKLTPLYFFILWESSLQRPY